MRMQWPLDEVERAVVRVWRASGRRPGTIHIYLLWVRKYRRYCAERGLCEVRGLTLKQVPVFVAAYSRTHRCHRSVAEHSARSAMRAWAIALRQLGHDVPQWTDAPPEREIPPIIAQFAEHRRLRSNVAPRTIRRDVDFASAFLRFVRRRGRNLDNVRLFDVDGFIMSLSERMTPKTLSGWCSALRVFFRFLRSAGIVRFDLAPAIMSPRVVAIDRPPRTLTWQEIRRLLRSLKRRSAKGRRAFAILLTMISYGLGAAEVSGLDLDDVDWESRTIRVRRPKTGVLTLLPLSPSVARALAAYIAHGRPPNTRDRAIFVQRAMPHERMSGSAVRHCVRDHTRAAGIRGGIGAHVLRHTHASRQIDGGAPPKTVGDILGHRDPRSTSVYVRVAIRRLRALSLPVPR